ncbi:hypothetical protein RVR_1521 [Actinacidiphila reveromycinica]|uniref:Uncharacterized protein n=1 Tax=Actinacidiphila reveromycinica TaxID=659352 RepID=A0A7U3VM66_9ACTN|nr:hypothetical protein [Streptomyces sp. SN-593]BBA96290.1 hypothetical protein RVR_1521 [Streptomyces sp. SN-593]
MEAELTALAASGATTLVQLMVQDTWGHLRGRLAAFFARGGGDGGAVGGQLDAARAELVAARQAGDAGTAADVEEEWRARLRRVLRADPDAATELRTLLAELGATPARGGTISVVHSMISGGTQGAVIQGRDINGAVTLGAWPPAEQPPRPDPAPDPGSGAGPGSPPDDTPD